MRGIGAHDVERAARDYEEAYVPALFRAWTSPVLDAARLAPGDSVLDVACGTGVLAREAATRVGTEGEVAGVDVSEAMLAVARRIEPAIAWRQAPAEDLPYDDETFDAVVSQFALMMFRDPPDAVGEMHRVLVPDGRLAVAVLDTLENAPVHAALAATLERLGHDVAASALRVPFAFGDTRLLTALFEEAGFGRIRVATQERLTRVTNVRSLVLADVRGWFPVAELVLDEDQLDAFVTEAEEALAPFVKPDGTVEFQTRAHIVSASAS